MNCRDLLNRETSTFSDSEYSPKDTKKSHESCHIYRVVLMMSAVTFAADLETAVTADDALQEVAEVNTEKVSFDRNSGSVEIVITAEGIDGDGNFCIKTPRTNMTLSGGIIEDCNMKSDSKKLPSIAVYGYAKKNSWKGSTLEIGIGCEATGKIKTYKGTCTVYKADGITK